MIPDTERQAWQAMFRIAESAVKNLTTYIRHELEFHKTQELKVLNDSKSEETGIQEVFMVLEGETTREEILSILHKILVRFGVKYMKADAFMHFYVGEKNQDNLVSVHMDTIQFLWSNSCMCSKTLPSYIWQSIRYNSVDARTARALSETITRTMFRLDNTFEYKLYIEDHSRNRFQRGYIETTDSDRWLNSVWEMQISMAVEPEWEPKIHVYLQNTDYEGSSVLLNENGKEQYEIVTSGDKETVIQFTTIPMRNHVMRYDFLSALVNFVGKPGDIHWLRGYGYRQAEYAKGPDTDEKHSYYFDSEKYDYQFGEHSAVGPALVVDRLSEITYDTIEAYQIGSEFCQLEADVIGDIAHHSNISNEIYITAK